MKKYSFLIILLSILSYSCEKDELTLPPETMEGKDTFGCLVNGEVWVKGGFSPVVSNLDVLILPNQFKVVARNVHASSNQTIVIEINDTLKEKTYFLNGVSRTASFIDSKIDCQYRTDTILGNGAVEINKLDTIQGIVSGKFSFDVVLYTNFWEEPNLDCDSIIRVTDGRFDLEFNPGYLKH